MNYSFKDEFYYVPPVEHFVVQIKYSRHDEYFYVSPVRSLFGLICDLMLAEPKRSTDKGRRWKCDDYSQYTHTTKSLSKVRRCVR